MTAFVMSVLLGVSVFVCWSGAGLPDVVATHFNTSGMADGFMTRSAYIGVMIATTVVVPGALYFLQRWAARRRLTNIRHRDYWFDDARAASTVRFLEQHAAWFSVALAVFMAVVHWLIVQAHASPAPQLNNRAFLGALGLLGGLILVWVVSLYVRFRR